MRAFFLRVCRLLACCVVTFTAAATEIEVIDDSGRAVLLKAPARRVIALSPHATELIFAAGGGDKLVATTVGSDYPIQALALPKLDDRQPFNRSVIAASVRKTGRLLAVDGDWATCGLAGEIIASIAEQLPPSALKAIPRRLTLPDSPAPTSKPLEKAYYFQAADVTSVALKVLGKK